MTKKMNRIIASITNISSGQLFCDQLYDDLSDFIESSNSQTAWIVDYFAPIPILSIETKDNVVDKIKYLLKSFNGPEYRIVLCSGDVNFGRISEKIHTAFGSMGVVLSVLLNATIMLPEGNSWVDENQYRLFQIDNSKPVKVVDRIFYPILDMK